MSLNYPKTLHNREYIATALLIILGIVRLKYHIYIKKKGKVIPLQARCGPEGG